MTDEASLLENSLAIAKEPTTEVFRESRGLDAYSPIVFWIGWIAILYFFVWLVAVYIGPAIFGASRPHPFYYGRSMGSSRQLHEDNMRKLTAHVLPALEKKQ